MKREFKINRKNCSLRHKDSEKVWSCERREHIRGPLVLRTAQIVHVFRAHSIMSCSQAGPLLTEANENANGSQASPLLDRLTDIFNHEKEGISTIFTIPMATFIL